MDKNNSQNQQDEQVDLIARMLAHQTGQLDNIGRTLAQHTSQLDTIALTVVKNTEDIEWIKDNMATKRDMNDMNNTLDQILGLVKKKDQELTFMGERVKRIENDVMKIKPLVGLT